MYLSFYVIWPLVKRKKSILHIIGNKIAKNKESLRRNWLMEKFHSWNSKFWVLCFRLSGSI